jgi:hypothetical protein
MRAKYPNIKIELTGSQLLSNAFSEAAQKDVATLTPLMFLIIALVLALTTRKFSGVMATMLVVTLSAAAAMGIGGWIGIPVSPPVSAAPTIILTVAVADCVHLLISALVSRGQGMDKRSAIIESVKINAQPVFLTSVTTAIGMFRLTALSRPRHIGRYWGVVCVVLCHDAIAGFNGHHADERKQCRRPPKPNDGLDCRESHCATQTPLDCHDGGDGSWHFHAAAHDL